MNRMSIVELTKHFKNAKLVRSQAEFSSLYCRRQPTYIQGITNNTKVSASVINNIKSEFAHQMSKLAPQVARRFDHIHNALIAITLETQA